MTLKELVNSHLADLNPTDLIIWRYILSHKKECCYISIYELAEACWVSRTTVLRFAKKLGLDGFSDLKMMLKLETSNDRVKPTQDLAEAAIDLCRKAGEEIAKQDFSQVNSLLYKARRIFIYPSGYLQRNIANEIIRYFFNCDLFITLINGGDEYRGLLPRLTNRDLIIIVSLSGESSHVIPFAQELNTQGIPFISMTRLKSNTLARLSTEHLYVTPHVLPAHIDLPYESMLGFFLLSEIWFVSYTRYLSEQTEEGISENNKGVTRKPIQAPEY